MRSPSAESFAAIVTFCVSILNATTNFIVSRFFGNPKKQPRASGRKQATDAAPRRIGNEKRVVDIESVDWPETGFPEISPKPTSS